MRFPRNTKLFRGQLDAAPFASVLFVFIILLLVQSSLVFTPGISVRLPEAVDLSGTTNPKLVVTVDDGGQIYFQNQITDERSLSERLSSEVNRDEGPLTLLIQADRGAKYDALVKLAIIAREVGIREVFFATRPKLIPVPTAPAGP